MLNVFKYCKTRRGTEMNMKKGKYRKQSNSLSRNILTEVFLCRLQIAFVNASKWLTKRKRERRGNPGRRRKKCHVVTQKLTQKTFFAFKRMGKQLQSLFSCPRDGSPQSMWKKVPISLFHSKPKIKDRTYWEIHTAWYISNKIIEMEVMIDLINAMTWSGTNSCTENNNLIN